MLPGIVTLWVLFAVGGAAQDMAVFQYDASAGLDLKTAATGHPRVLDISYASPKGGRVPGYLVVPQGKGPFAGVVFVHWGQGNRSEFLSEAVALVASGVESILIDAPFNRVDNPSKTERDALVQLVVDTRRAVDVLVSRKEVDAKRIGYVGHSLGATWGGALAGCEKRFRALVLMAGLPRVSKVDPPDPLYKLRMKDAPVNEELAKIDPVLFVGKSGPASLFFQWAKVDRFVSEEAAKEYFAAAGEPKSQKRYYTSHELNDPQASADRRKFLLSALH